MLNLIILAMTLGWQRQSFKTQHCLAIRIYRCFRGAKLHSISNVQSTNNDDAFQPKKIAIIGGGLAGLSTAYHLIEKLPTCRIEVFDTSSVGKGGASSVAGGLIHPLSPRGKLVHWGLEGLEATNRLIDVAQCHALDKSIVLREEIYRVALNEENVVQLQQSANELPHLCEWLDAEAMRAAINNSNNNSNSILGGIRLQNGCRIIDVPTYLEALWKACQQRAVDKSGEAVWNLLPSGWNDDQKDTMKDKLSTFDAVVLACGSGLFTKNLLGASNFSVQLVRGQSIELIIKSTEAVKGLLCGKYVLPMSSSPHHALVGATHEFKNDALSKEAVLADLREKTEPMISSIWQNSSVEKITSGYRVQTKRGKYGRMPIIGKLTSKQNTIKLHNNTWIFTGLSSRGLLHHALYGDILTDAMIAGDEEIIYKTLPDLTWWK